MKSLCICSNCEARRADDLAHDLYVVGYREAPRDTLARWLILGIALLGVGMLAIGCDMPGTSVDFCQRPELVTAPAAIAIDGDPGMFRAKARLTAESPTILVRVPNCGATHGLLVAISSDQSAGFMVLARAKDTAVIDESRTGVGGVELSSGPSLAFVEITMVDGEEFIGDFSITVLP